MPAISKISIAQIVYNAIGSEDIEAAKFDQYIRMAFRACQQLYSFQALEPVEKEEVIVKHTIVIPLETMIIDAITVEGIQAYYTGENLNILGNSQWNEMYRESNYKFNYVNNNVVFNWKHGDSLDGKKCRYQVRKWTRDADGFISVPFQYEEAIITFIRKENAYDAYAKSNGRMGRGLWQDMDNKWEQYALEAESQVELADKAQWNYIMNLWNTKVPISTRVGYRQNERLI